MPVARDGAGSASSKSPGFRFGKVEHDELREHAAEISPLALPTSAMRAPPEIAYLSNRRDSAGQITVACAARSRSMDSASICSACGLRSRRQSRDRPGVAARTPIPRFLPSSSRREAL
jgi:hypothetical protein